MDINSPLLHLALLESLKANDITDDIDLFLPFIAVTISELGKLEIAPIDIQRSMEAGFGIKPPISAIHVILARAKKRGLITKKNGAFIPCGDIIEKWKNGFDSKKEDIAASIVILRKDLSDFAKERFSKEITIDECDALLVSFIETNISCVASHRSYTNANLAEKIKNTDHITASFISHIHKNKTESLDHFGRCVKGMLLANYLCYADKASQKSDYSSMTAYLDTPIVVALLGFSGSQRQKSVHELLDLLKSINVKICIFDKTLNEIESLLFAWKSDFKAKRFARFNTKTLELLRSLGYDEIRLDTEIKLLDSRVRSHGIDVKIGFNAKPKYQCDETALSGAILSAFPDKKEVSHDTVCVSRIHNMREGKTIGSLNDSFSVFVSPSNRLVRAANDFFVHEIPKKSVPLVVSEQWLTAMFWLKCASIFGSLPVDQIVASAYSLLYTDDKFWHGFVERLESLEKKHTISHEDYVLVRWDSDLLGMVHDISVDVGDDFSDDDVFEIVKKIKEKSTKDKDIEIKRIKDESAEIIDAEIEEKNRLLASYDFVLRRAEKIGCIIGYVAAGALSAFLIACLLLAAYSTVPLDIIPSVNNAGIKHTVPAAAAIIIAALFALIGRIRSITVTSIFNGVSAFIKNKVVKFIVG